VQSRNVQTQICGQVLEMPLGTLHLDDCIATFEGLLLDRQIKF
jgi:hypothetical protein